MVRAREVGTWIKVVLALVVSSLVWAAPVHAHEVQPGVMDVEISGDQLDLYIEWVLEAPIAGLDLDGLNDTNDAAGAEAYDLLRALEPDRLAREFTSLWPVLSDKITVRAGVTPVPLELKEVDVPDVGDTELSRTSTVHLTAFLPPDGTPLIIGWAAELGPLVVRQRNVDGGYAGYLISGALSEQIPRTGASEQTATEALADYIGVGFDHIVPKGLDHILFVLGLFFLSLHLRPLLWQVTAFTLAHTVTLALGALDIIRISPDIVEPLIAASIVYVGVENLLVRELHPWRPAVVFCFGLLHGLGFASVLSDFGLGADHFLAKLIGFNVGVELGQLAVIAAAYLTLAVLFGRHGWWHRRIAAPVSVTIAVIAAFWILERTGLTGAGAFWTDRGLPPSWAILAVGFVVSVTTAIALFTPAATGLRDALGFATSLAAFAGIVATFSSAAWITSALLTALWVLAIRFQALGET